MGDDRVISCMNAVKSVECVLKKAQNNLGKPMEKQEKTLSKMERAMNGFKCVEMFFLDVSSPKKRGHGFTWQDCGAAVRLSEVAPRERC